LIDEPKNPGKNQKIKNLWIEPEIKANPKANKAIMNADYIFLGPGDLYTSVLVNLVLPQIRNSIKKSKANLIYIANLMSKKGQISNMNLKDLCREIEKYAKRRVNTVIVNNARVKKEILLYYSKYGEKLIENDLNDPDIKVFTDNIIDNVKIEKDKNDKLERSVLRHSAKKLNKIFKKIIG
jgi:uncharacterized cofD-like protein